MYPFCNWLFEHLAIRDWRRGWLPALLCGSLFAMPILAYMGLLRLTGMTNWNHDVDVERYRYFIWMIDDLRKGMFVEIPLQWLNCLGTHMTQVAAGWAAPWSSARSWLCEKT